MTVPQKWTALAVTALAILGTEAEMCRPKTATTIISPTNAQQSATTDVSSNVSSTVSLSDSDSDFDSSTSLSIPTTSSLIDASSSTTSTSFSTESSDTSSTVPSDTPSNTSFDLASTTFEATPTEPSTVSDIIPTESSTTSEVIPTEPSTTSPTSSALASSPTPENYIVNSGFESGSLDPWSSVNPGGTSGFDQIQTSSSTCSGHADSGHYLIWSGVSGSSSTLSQNLNLKAGHTYYLNFWYALGTAQSFGQSGQHRCGISMSAQGGSSTTYFGASNACQWTAGNQATFVPYYDASTLYINSYCSTTDSVDILLDDVTIVDSGLPPVAVTPPDDD